MNYKGTGFKVIIVSGLFLFGLLCLMGGIFVYNLPGNDLHKKWPNQAFSTEAWKASVKEHRYVFYNNLVEDKILDNLLRKDVVTLLGKPDFEAPGGTYITYILKYAATGEYSLNSIYMLHIEFDKHDKVLRYYLRAD